MILECDLDFIRKSGYQIITPVLLSNSTNYTEVKITEAKQVPVKEILLTANQ